MRATLETLGIVCVVGLAQAALSLVGLGSTLALSTPLSVAPWTVLTSVYAHGSVGHLLANALALLLVGPLVERRTTRLRFHAFVVASGALAGMTQVILGGLVGPPSAVLGISGAIFALGGYLLAGNAAAATLFDRLRVTTRAQFALFAAVAVLLTLATAAPGVALLAHAAGAFVGLLAGRARLLER
jgi:membrane associated rhomboid family serine protease